MRQLRQFTAAARITLWAPLLALVGSVGCDLDHMGGADSAPPASGGSVAVGGTAAAGSAPTSDTTAGTVTGGGASGAVQGTGTEATAGAPHGTGGDATGGGGSVNTGGVGTGGATNDPECPTTAPTNEDGCTPRFGPPLECTYESAVCACYGFGAGASWNCSSGDCPAVMPWGSQSCAGLDGTTCPYGSSDCVCQDGTWTCN